MHSYRLIILALLLSALTIGGCRRASSKAPTTTPTTTIQTNSAATPVMIEKSPPSRPGELARVSPGLKAIRQAAREKKTIFVLLYKGETDTTRQLRERFEQDARSLTGPVAWISVNLDDPASQLVVAHYQLQRAPVPLILVIAPNGAITGSLLPDKTDRQRMADCLVGPQIQECMKNLQRNKIVLLSLQNEQTKLNAEALRGAYEFQRDSPYSNMTTVVVADPAAAENRPFLERFQIPTNLDTATTIFFFPPRAVVGTIKGATDKESLMTLLKNESDRRRALLEKKGFNLPPPGSVITGDIERILAPAESSHPRADAAAPN